MTADQIAHGFEDHATFCRESLLVEAEDKRLGEVPMILGPGQVKLDEAIQRQRELQLPVRILYLKSRRVQASTGTAAEFFHDTIANPGVRSLVLGHQEDSTRTLFNMYKRFHLRYQPFGGVITLPQLIDSRGLPLHTPLSDRLQYANHSEIVCHTAGSVTYGRSERFTNVHFSEFPYYQNSAEIRTAVMSAVPKLPETCVVIEGTAATVGDEFHAMCTEAQAGRSDWIFLFMAWQEHPGNRMPLVISLEQFMHQLSREDRDTYERLGLRPEQMHWYLYTLRNDCNNDRQKMRREHPCSPEEAFTASSRNRFSVPHIMRMPVQRNAMTGEVETRLVGDEERLVWIPNDSGCVKMYRRPERGRVYAAGADCSQGIDAAEGGSPDPDYWTTQIFDRDTAEQCAVARARKMPGESGRYLAKLLRFYNNAQCAGERNPGGGGIAMLEAVLNSDYPASYLYHDVLNPDEDPQVRGTRLGWSTSGASRPLLISYLDDAIREEAIIVHDPQTQAELLTFVYWPDGKARAQKRCHDDLVIALALVLIVILRMPRPKPPGTTTMPAPMVRKYGQSVESQSRGRLVRLR
ncbi:MAG TPA: hypothetical protein VN776_16380 [Terracidiphilus sp.]|nr:hypothetical protein [Terracidiphilus sp.]